MKKILKMLAVVAVLGIAMTLTLYLTTLETRSVPYQESYQESVYRTDITQEPVYRMDTSQEPVYRIDYYTEKEPYVNTVPNTGTVSYTVIPKVCDDNGRRWLGLRFRAGISQYEVINTDSVTGIFTLFVGMFLSDGKRVGQEITKTIVAGGSDIFEYRLDINENITCTYNVISATKAGTTTVTNYNNVQKSKQVIDHYETKSNQVIDHYETKSNQVIDHYETRYITKYQDITKMRYQWW